MQATESRPFRSIMFTEARRLQLQEGTGLLRGAVVRLPGIGVSIGHVSSNGHEVELRETDHLTFLLPREGWLAMRVRDHEFRVRQGQLMAFRPTDRVTRANPGLRRTFHASTLLVPNARLRALAEQAGARHEAVFERDGTDLSGLVGRYFGSRLGRLSDDLLLRRSSDLPVKVATEIGYLVDEQLCELIGRMSDRPASRRILPAFHRVRLAEDIMHDHSDEPMSMLDLAASLDVSLRSLQLAFNEVHGQGPRDVLNRIRLGKARARLLAAEDTAQVTTIALDSGFGHLSRFAQDYGRAFGERPSETLRRRRA
jgi:AraC-like DNA-binding protein